MLRQAVAEAGRLDIPREQMGPGSWGKEDVEMLTVELKEAGVLVVGRAVVVAATDLVGEGTEGWNLEEQSEQSGR